MKALITGITGFVGRHLAQYLLHNGFSVWGTSRQSTSDHFINKNINVIYSDLNNETEITNIINTIRPDHIYHLAGQSSVKKSWDHKQETFQSNVITTIHLLEGLQKSELASHTRILTVGSAEEYGTVEDRCIPIKETELTQPISPYGISKVTVSMLAKHYYQATGMKINHVRTFNHIGPGQSLGFVTTDFAEQIVLIEKGLRDPIMKVGNLSAIRDFTDVRDIVRAYEKINSSEAQGGIFNVCSGVGTSIENILNVLLQLSVCNILIEVDPAKFRSIDVPLYVGDNTKLKKIINWEPIIPLHQTLEDILNDYRAICK